MPLLTEEQINQLLINGSPENREKDHVPVAMLVLPDAQASWLLTCLEPDKIDIAFGLCDVGLGYPVMCTVSIKNLESMTGLAGLKVEVETDFLATDTISRYASAARLVGFITTDRRILDLSDTNTQSREKSPRRLQGLAFDC